MDKHNGHPLDEPLNSSARDFELFIKDSLVWRDIEQTIRDRINILMDELIAEEDREKFIRLQTEIRVWKEMAAIPHYLKEHAKVEQTVKEQNNAKDQNS